jgi:Domain of unknown function (DUF4386)
VPAFPPAPIRAAAWGRQSLHIESVSQPDLVTCGGGGKGALTYGFRSWSIPVATLRFSMSCGIDAGSTAAERYNHLRRSSDSSDQFGHTSDPSLTGYDRAVHDDRATTPETKRLVLRLGGGAAVAGAALGLVGNLIHPSTAGPDEPAETARVVADSSIWVSVHLGLIVAFILMLVGLVAIHDSIGGGLPGVLVRFGLFAAVVGTAGGVVLLALDGFAAKHLADSWSSAPAEARATALAAFRAEDSINFALLSPLNLVFAGFTFVLYGLGASLSGRYPAWLGWVAVIGGAGGAVSGVIQASIGEPTSATTALGIVAPSLITLWLLVMGILMIQRSSTWP